MTNTKDIEQQIAEIIAVLRHEPVASTTIAKQIIEAMQQEPDETIRKQQELLAVARDTLRLVEEHYAEDSDVFYQVRHTLKQLREAIDD